MSNEPTFAGALRQMLGLNTGAMITNGVLLGLLVNKGILTTQEVHEALDYSEAEFWKSVKSDPDLEAGLRTYLSSVKMASKGAQNE